MGIRVKYLRKFVDLCGGKERLKGKTTRAVVEEFIKPVTSKKKCSLCKLLLNQKDPKRYIGRANVFICHAWNDSFLDLVETLENSSHFFYTERDSHSEKTILWIDIFSYNQHIPTHLDIGWMSLFQKIVEKIHFTLLVPSTQSLSRAWCIWEISCTLRSKGKFSVASKQRPSKYYGIVRSVIVNRSEESVCSFVEDQELIRARIQSSGSFADVDSLIRFAVLKEFLFILLSIVHIFIPLIIIYYPSKYEFWMRIVILGLNNMTPQIPWQKSWSFQVPLSLLSLRVLVFSYIAGMLWHLGVSWGMIFIYFLTEYIFQEESFLLFLQSWVNTIKSLGILFYIKIMVYGFLIERIMDNQPILNPNPMFICFVFNLWSKFPFLMSFDQDNSFHSTTIFESILNGDNDEYSGIIATKPLECPRIFSEYKSSNSNNTPAPDLRFLRPSTIPTINKHGQLLGHELARPTTRRRSSRRSINTTGSRLTTHGSFGIDFLQKCKCIFENQSVLELGGGNTNLLGIKLFLETPLQRILLTESSNETLQITKSVISQLYEQYLERQMKIKEQLLVWGNLEHIQQALNYNNDQRYDLLIGMELMHENTDIPNLVLTIMNLTDPLRGSFFHAHLFNKSGQEIEMVKEFEKHNWVTFQIPHKEFITPNKRNEHSEWPLIKAFISCSSERLQEIIEKCQLKGKIFDGTVNY